MAIMRSLPALLAASLVLLLTAGAAQAQKPGERIGRVPDRASAREAARNEREIQRGIDRLATHTSAASSQQRDVGDTERALPYLAYTLGELHYLASSCEGLDSQAWRQRMIELLAMEAAEPGRRRDRMIESFNDGYRVQQRRRPVCGEEVEIERRALAHRGHDLSEMMRAAYFD
ncbi:TIGR02301 family protein [uncultured Maricaulis sp.]|uniref:TIGR02301 family protein n=1 Tax=uncultured Maricaulis sp. TaxID=174710 RepID=UPI0030DC4086|tara:strand:- start:32541 stop:33062 length:522 start_codon:yes stop_codon:yes gene_type:complete